MVVIGAENWYTQKKGAKLQIKGVNVISEENITFSEPMREWAERFKSACESAWPGIEPKESNSFGSDYGEIYVKAQDNNAYFTLSSTVKIHRAWTGDDLIYEFSKAKAAGLLYDLCYRK